MVQSCGSISIVSDSVSYSSFSLQIADDEFAKDDEFVKDDDTLQLHPFTNTHMRLSSAC